MQGTARPITESAFRMLCMEFGKRKKRDFVASRISAWKSEYAECRPENLRLT